MRAFGAAALAVGLVWATPASGQVDGGSELGGPDGGVDGFLDQLKAQFNEHGEFQPRTWGEFDPGKGFMVAKTPLGEVSISIYALLRWMNQLPADQTYFDHLGNEHVVDTRRDIQFHRAMVNFRGWVFLPKLKYVVTMWTVLSAQLFALIGTLTYEFHKMLNLSAGIDGMPGIRTLTGSHPYWLGNDRTMAEEFIRPGFTAVLSLTGELFKGFFYKLSFGNNVSQLNITSMQLNRYFAVGGSVWWMPTTGEFGPRGGQGDFEHHDKVATRFGISSVRSPEQHYTPLSQPPGSTQVRLADGVVVFDTGALAPGVTVETATYWNVSFDAGLKYRGIYLQTEFTMRWLYDFKANGEVPVGRIFDKSLYLLASFFPIRDWWELYGGTSFAFGDRAAGFGTQWEVIAGTNVYPAQLRNMRITLHAIYVDRSAAGGSFGYYAAGQKGPTITLATSIFF